MALSDLPKNKQGQYAELDNGRRLAAIAHLSRAATTLAMQNAGPGVVDLGGTINEICGALIDLGFDAESNSGGFGRAPTLTLNGVNHQPGDGETE